MLIYMQFYGHFDMQIITNDYAIIIKSISPNTIYPKFTGLTSFVYLFKFNKVEDLWGFSTLYDDSFTNITLCKL